MPEPEIDTVAEVIASVIASARSAEEIGIHTGLPTEAVDAAVARLTRENLIHSADGQGYQATQSRCSGRCFRSGRGFKGKPVVIDSKTLLWMCAGCWETRPEQQPPP